jgi:hypothetical protein
MEGLTEPKAKPRDASRLIAGYGTLLRAGERLVFSRQMANSLQDCHIFAAIRVGSMKLKPERLNDVYFECDTFHSPTYD